MVTIMLDGSRHPSEPGCECDSPYAVGNDPERALGKRPAPVRSFRLSAIAAPLPTGMHSRAIGQYFTSDINLLSCYLFSGPK